MAVSINSRGLEKYEIKLTSELCIDNNKKKYEIKLTSELCIDNNKKGYKWCTKCMGEG